LTSKEGGLSNPKATRRRKTINERELIPGTIEPKLNEILKPYGLRLIVIHDESNTEHEPEKLLEIARNIALMDLEFEVKELGE
jgi:hypothetical protein